MGEDVTAKLRVRWSESLRRYFLAGLLVFLPLAITLWFIGWVIGLLDSVLDVLPGSLHPNTYLPFAIPKLGAVVTLLLILFLGVLTSVVATRRFLAAWEKIFIQIPVFRGVYTATQKLVQTFLGQSNAQRQVVMIEYPRAGVFTVGFAMGRAWDHLEEKINAPLVNVFVPTSPAVGVHVTTPVIGSICMPLGWFASEYWIVCASSSGISTSYVYTSVAVASGTAVVENADGMVRSTTTVKGVEAAAPLANVPIPSVRWGERNTTLITYLFLDPELNLVERNEVAHQYADALPPPASGAERGVTGSGPARLAQFEEIDRVLPWIEAATIAVILLVVALYFRSLGAPLVTLACAGLAYVIAVRVIV